MPKSIQQNSTTNKSFFSYSPEDKIILGIASISLVIRLLTNGNYTFHRDELLYLSLGKHLDFGYWSNAPSIGFFSFLAQNLLGDSVEAIRFFPSLFGALTVVLTALMAREFGGKGFAQTLAAAAAILTPAQLRLFSMYNPVPFDVFYWTLFSYLVVRYLNTQKSIYLLYFGIALGFGLLNKYSVIFYVAALLAGLMLTPHRRLFRSPHFYGAVAIAFILFLPNLIWQWSYNFPVVRHMALLRANQLVNVQPSHFIIEQFLLHFPVVLVWLFGLYFLLWSKKGKTFRLLGWTSLGVFLLFLITKGKAYYTLGIFPAMMAAGAYQIERITQNGHHWFRYFIWAKALLITFLILPLGLSVLPPPSLLAYCDFLKSKLGLDAPMRWEDGQVHQLPQDYADMFAWEEIAQLTAKAYHRLDKEDQTNTLIYGEYYCHAGAVDHYAKKYQLPEAFCFSDSYRYWVPDAYPESINRMIYINHELGEDVQNLFAQVEKIGELSHPYARENGLGVYLLQAPRSSFAAFLNERIAAVKAPFKNIQ